MFAQTCNLTRRTWIKSKSIVTENNLHFLRFARNCCDSVPICFAKRSERKWLLSIFLFVSENGWPQLVCLLWIVCQMAFPVGRFVVLIFVSKCNYIHTAPRLFFSISGRRRPGANRRKTLFPSTKWPYNIHFSQQCAATRFYLLSSDYKFALWRFNLFLLLLLLCFISGTSIIARAVR